MTGLPIMLQVEGRRCVVVGGGAVATRRVRSLLERGAAVTVIAPRIEQSLAELAITHEARDYADGDLVDALLVVIATDQSAVNEAVAREAQARGVLINRADAPATGDFVVPAHTRHGAVTIAVDTSGISAAAAAAIRRQLSASLDPDWPRLLEAVEPYRATIQHQCPDPQQRTERLRRLTDDAAMNILKTQGEDALRRHCAAIAAPPRPSDG